MSDELLEDEISIQKAVAHHEAAHIVLAAVGGLALKKWGIYIDRKGQGIAFDWGADPRDLDTNREREAAMVANYAGRIAQMKKQYGSDIGCGSQNDADKIVILAGEMYPNDRMAFDACRENASKRSEELVDQYWSAIVAVAERLLEKEWKPADRGIWESPYPVKHLEAFEVVEILKEFNISACIKEWETGDAKI